MREGKDSDSGTQGELLKLVKDAAKEGRAAEKKPARRRKVPAVKIDQTTIGDGNVTIGQFSGSIKTSKVKVTKAPVPGTIGANPFLKQRIQEGFNSLGEARKKRLGDLPSVFPAMYKTFKRDFDIGNVPWTVIWDWPEQSAQAIVDYLQAKVDNTIDGKITKAATRPGYRHTRPQLYAQEKELLEHLGWDMKSPQVKQLLMEFFGKSSHADLTYEQHLRLVSYFRQMVEKMEG